MTARWNVAAGFAGSAWSAVMALIFVPVYVHYLGIEGWGAVGFFATLQGWLAFIDTGLSPAFNREFARFRAGTASESEVADLLRSAEYMYLGLAAAMIAGVWAASPWLATRWLRAETLEPSSLVSALRWLAVAIALQWFASLYRQALLGLQRQVMPNATSGFGATARGLTTWLVMAWISPSLSLFVCVQFILAAIEMLVLRGYLRRRVPALRNGAWRNDVFARTRSFAGGLTGVALLGIVLAQGDKLLLSALLPLEQFGFVTLAVMVAGSLGLVATPTFSLSYPRLSERAAAGDEGTFADEYRRWTQWLGVLVLPAAALLIFFPRDLLALWTRNDAVAQAAAPLVALWTVGTALNALMHMPYAAQLAQGWTRLSLALNALAATLLLPLTLWLVPQFGPVAAGWIWACINFLCVTLGVPLMHRRIMRGGLLAWYSRALLLPGLAAFAVTGAVAAWRDMQPALATMPLLALLACTLAASGAAAVAVTPYPRAMIAALLRRAA